MRRSANMTLIGAFVAGGILLIIAAVVLLGAGSFTGAKPEAIAYFEDSVSGLDIGAPVKFRGVTVGKVSQVLLHTSGQAVADYAVPVVMEFSPDLLTRRGLDQALLQKAGLGVSIGKGLRAKLQQQSVVTGVLYVELDYFPGSTFKLHAKDGPLPEIPTEPSNLGALTKAISQTLDQLSRIDFVNLVAASANIVKITGDPTIPRAVADFSAAMQGVDTLVKRLSGKVDPVADDIRGMAAAGRKALERLNETSEHLRTLTKPGSPARRDLDQALADVSEAAQAIRSLADFLERNPETIIQGRSKSPAPAAEPKEAPPVK
jgi:paraquat-inducible protein B